MKDDYTDKSLTWKSLSICLKGCKIFLFMHTSISLDGIWGQICQLLKGHVENYASENHQI